MEFRGLLTGCVAFARREGEIKMKVISSQLATGEIEVTATIQKFEEMTSPDVFVASDNQVAGLLLRMGNGDAV